MYRIAAFAKAPGNLDKKFSRVKSNFLGLFVQCIDLKKKLRNFATICNNLNLLAMNYIKTLFIIPTDGLSIFIPCKLQGGEFR